MTDLKPGTLARISSDKLRKVYWITRPHAKLSDYVYARRWSHARRTWTEERRYTRSRFAPAPEDWPQVRAIRKRWKSWDGDRG